MNEFLKGKQVILASNSPRRKELLSLLCDRFQVVPSLVDEAIDDETFKSFSNPANDVPRYLATLKAKDIAIKHYDSVVIGCDTVVSADDIMLGKPVSYQEAQKMLGILSGRTHKVVSGVCICYEGIERSFVCETLVHFRILSQNEIDSYIATGAPMDKAGAYGIQGLGGLFSTGITGDFYNVVGLPVSMLNDQLNRFYEK